MSTDREQLIVPATDATTKYGSTTNCGAVPVATEDIIDEMRPLNLFQKIGFGLGHIFNDLCAGIWFSYTLLFLQNVLTISPTQAGLLVMLGQVGDAIATPIIGKLTDRIGTKRSWHAIGTLLVLTTFPLIFSVCPWCTSAPAWWQPTYFSITILIFQIGWAIVQITHLAMITELSQSQADRSDLTTYRYSSTIVASIFVYVLTWLLLQGQSMNKNHLTPADAFRFRDISLYVCLVGVSQTVLFHIGLIFSKYDIRRKFKAPDGDRRQSDEATESLTSASTSSGISSSPDEETSLIAPQIRVRRPRQLWKTAELYQTGLLYVFSRIFVTTVMIYQPLWLDERAETAPVPAPGEPEIVEAVNMIELLAIVPLVNYIASFITALIHKQCTRWIGHHSAYMIGCAICIGGCLGVYFIPPSRGTFIELLVIAALLGCGSSITMVSSMSITADMIGTNTKDGGFIYSLVTFIDKLITGIVVALIEEGKCSNRVDCPHYYRLVLAIGCGLTTIGGAIVLLTILCTKKPAERDQTHHD